MIEIASAANLGLSNGSLAHLKSNAQPLGIGRDGARVAVNIANGNLVMQREDDALAARGPDVALVRTYNSQGTADYDNNDNWRIGFYRQVRALSGTVNTAGSTVLRVDADGAESSYGWDAARAAYVGAEGAGSHDLLTYDGLNWTWTDGDARRLCRHRGRRQ